MKFEIEIDTNHPDWKGMKEQLEDINGEDDMTDLSVMKEIFYVLIGGQYDDWDLRDIVTVKQI